MEGVSDEYYNQKEQEVINFYKKYSKEDPEVNNFYKKYINLLQLCQELGSSNAQTREKTRQPFDTALKEVHAYKQKVGAELFEVSMEELFVMIDIMMSSLKWEGKAGALAAATALLEKYSYRDFEDKTFNACFDMLFKKEFSLVQSLLSYVKAYAQKHGPECFQEVQQRLYVSIDECWEKYDNTMEEEGQSHSFSANARESTRTRLETYKTLDSLYKMLSVFLELMPENSKLFDGHILELIYKTKKHPQEEVRVSGVELMGKILTRVPETLWKEHLINIGNLIVYSMSDDSSAVRHQATKTIITFMDRAAIDNSLNQFTDIAVPRILINRYHPAQPLAKDAIALWKTYLEKIGKAGKGRDVLSELANQACEFYLTQLKKTHPEILKAACSVMNELVTKVQGSAATVKAHFDEIMELCFDLTRHESSLVKTSCWRVLENLVGACPDEIRKKLGEIVDIGFFHISFTLNKEDVAESVSLYLAAVYKTFQEEVHQTFVEKIKEHIGYCTRGDEVIQLKEERDPITSKEGVVRPKAFEVVTGALILLARLIPIKIDIVEPNLELLHNIVQLKNVAFNDSIILYAWKVFQKAFSTWTDKKVVRSEMEAVLESLLRDVNSAKAPIVEETSAVIKAIVEKVGLNVFKARAENLFGGKYSKLIDKVMAS